MAEVTIATPAVSDKATLKADPPHPEEVKDATDKVEQPAASNSETEAQSAAKGEEDAKAVVEGGDDKEKMLDAMRQSTSRTAHKAFSLTTIDSRILLCRLQLTL